MKEILKFFKKFNATKLQQESICDQSLYEEFLLPVMNICRNYLRLWIKLILQGT